MTYAILVAIIAFLIFLLGADALGACAVRERVARLEAQLKQAQDQAAPAARAVDRTLTTEVTAFNKITALRASVRERDERIVFLKGLHDQAERRLEARDKRIDQAERRLEARDKRIELLEEDVQRLSNTTETEAVQQLRQAVADEEERNNKLKQDITSAKHELKIAKARSLSDWDLARINLKQQGKALREAQDELARTKFESEIRRRAHEVSHGVASRLKDKLDRIQKETQD